MDPASLPTVWQARILKYLDELAVYLNALTNSNFEGTPRVNGTVKAYRVSNVGVSDYDGAWTDSDWEELQDVEFTLTIDQAKKVLVKVPDTKDNQSIINYIDQGGQRTAQAISDVIDQFIASNYAAVAPANNYGDDTTPIIVGLGAGEIRPTVFLSLLRERLVKASAPRSSLRAVLPVWMATMLEIELSGRATSLGDQAQRGAYQSQQGLVMEDVSGFKRIYASTNCPEVSEGTQAKILAGDPLITYASAIDKFQNIQLQNDFATGLRGLYCYGASLWDGNYMGLGTANRGSYTA